LKREAKNESKIPSFPCLDKTGRQRSFCNVCQSKLFHITTMKLHQFLLSGLFLATLTSCWVTPRPARNPYSPGGRAITPMERHDRSVLSPGGRVITPRERYRRWH
jgi:hypothetical protein